MADIDVVHEELRTHSEHVKGLGERLDECAKTGSHTNLGPTAFGIIGEPFAGLIFPALYLISEMFTHGAEEVRHVAQKLVECADHYETTEKDITAMFGGS